MAGYGRLAQGLCHRDSGLEGSRLVSLMLSVFPLILGLVGLTSFYASPVAAAEGVRSPIRSSTNAGVWSTGSDAFRDFVQTGVIRDRGLDQLIRLSGWTSEELRAAFVKSYPVRIESVAYFLGSESGVLWLRNQTRSYVPFSGLRNHAVQALRAAVLADAKDGSISAVGIMARLPVDFRLASGFKDFDGVQNACAVARCEDFRQCTSLLSWLVFLPACLQANSVGSIAGSLSR